MFGSLILLYLLISEEVPIPPSLLSSGDARHDALLDRIVVARDTHPHLGGCDLLEGFISWSCVDSDLYGSNITWICY